ncbi:phasin family protein [Phreatobacter stygius]|uniref:Phasin family protein n=1 Tax=Phreatobacter stygius TaxID=1940610 RepID=A0A4D7BD68_9HYPH|nr:phasin family protein [Phreatobacter stygius]QCI68615.1 phasin family protein [Phreatobacter stygius]
MLQNFDDVQKLGKDGLDRTVKSLTAVTKGYQAITAEVVDYAKKSFEESSAAVEKFAAVKSLDKAIELQSTLVKSAYETAVARATKIGELYSDLAKEIYKPYEGVFGKAAAAK